MIQILERLRLTNTIYKLQRKIGIRKLKNLASVFSHNHFDHIFLTPDPQTLIVWEKKLAKTSQAD
jgi:hypothetical protein